MNSLSNLYYHYWGKARTAEENDSDLQGSGSAYHLLPYHCLDVAAVGKALLDRHPHLLSQLGNLSGMGSKAFLDWSTFLLALHDIGKFADGFQNLRPDLFQQLQKRSTAATYHEHHDALGYRFCLDCAINVLTKVDGQDRHVGMFEADLQDLLKPWLGAVAGHHGRPPKLTLMPLPLHHQFPDQVRQDTLTFIEELMVLLLPNGLPFQANAFDYFDYFDQAFRRISWLMAGLAVAADWIGSNHRWFRYHNEPMSLADYWNTLAMQQAAQAVDECGLATVAIAPSAGMPWLFPDLSLATPLQQLAEQGAIGDGPQLFIIEEVTGGGKTEAALTLAHRLMDKGLADGLFMALPTMATANAMHKRVRKMYRKLFVENSEPSFILAHSANRMTLDLERKNITDRGYSQKDDSASQDCAIWLGDSRKKALLAHVGVGTIDQALLAILATRHQSLRLLGLNRKVLIVDEVHACDAYVHRLLRTLLQFHAALGNSAILLSATLPQGMRAELLKSFTEGIGGKALELKSNDYPLLTHFSAGDVQELPVAARKSASRQVGVQPLYSIDEINKNLQEILDAGGCVCWVRNTVYDALQAYREWLERLGENRLMLFHARFTLWDRLRIEQEVIRSFGLESKEEDRRGRLLIATQVVEQSLDLDFDFMVSDLAPIDLLIQRAGRLQRHLRGSRKPPVLGVYMPQPMKDAGRDWFKGMFSKAAGVYKHHGQLWLTAKWMDEHKGFSMPDDARKMIEWVYGDQSQAEIPDSLLFVENNSIGEDSANRGLGSLNSLKLDEGYQATTTQWPDDLSAPTRLGEPTVMVRLGCLRGKQLGPWINENTGHDWELSQLSIRKFRIAKEDPGYLPEIVAAAKKTMPDEGRYCLVIPMQQSGERWIGQALNSQDKRVEVTYDSRLGLEVNNEEGCE